MKNKFIYSVVIGFVLVFVAFASFSASVSAEVEPQINLTKTVVYDAGQQKATYTINWSVTGNSVSDLTITDTLPAWVDGVVNSISLAPTPALSSGDLNYDNLNPNDNREIIWELGDREDGTNGVITFKVELLAKETCEIAPNKVSAVGTYSSDSSEGDVLTDIVYSEGIDVNDAHCEEPEDPKDDPENSCLIIDTSEVSDSISFLPSPEPTVQQILDSEFGANVVHNFNDQIDAKTWDLSPIADSVSFDVKLLAKHADQRIVFGYYKKGDNSSFVPLFKVGNHTDHLTVPTLAVGSSVSIVVPSSFASSIGFAIDAQKNQGTPPAAIKFFSEPLLNTSNDDVTAVYNTSDNEYVLAFENLPLISSDKDYNDMVVKISKIECKESDLACDSSINLIQNGGFEAPALAPNTWSIVPDSNPLLKWLVAWVGSPSAGTLGLEIQNNVAGLPFAGSQHAELDGDHPVKIWQNVVTVPSQLYSLTFQYSPRPGRNLADNSLQVRVDNSQLGADISADGTANGNTVWTPITRTFTAATALTNVELYDNGTDTSFGAYVDNVSLNCVNDVPPPPPVDVCPNDAGVQTNLEECTPDEDSCEVDISTSNVISDATTTFIGDDVSGSASLLSFIHGAWTANVGNVLAKWIWSADPVNNTTTNDNETFTKTFIIAGTPTSATLNIAADNYYTAKVNGTTVSSDQVNGNTFSGAVSVDVLAYLVNGSNTITVEATNLGVANSNATGNPAGIIFNLDLEQNSCVPPPPPDVTVTIVKYIQEEGGNVPATAGNTNSTVFPFTSTWTAANLNGGAETSGDFSLGPVTYSATTSDMNSGANYSVVENLKTECTANNAGQYALVGYQTGSTLGAALGSTVGDSASFTNLQDDMYVVVINKLCGEVAGETSSSNTTVVDPNDMKGWTLLNYDTGTAIDSSTTTTTGTGGYFVFGPAVAPLTLGSFHQEIGTNGDDATRLLTSDFNGVLLSSIKKLEYSTFVSANVGGQATYLQIRVDWDNDGDQDDRLFFEPVYQTGTYGMHIGGTVPNQCIGITNCVDLNTWQTWDADAGGFWSDTIGAGGPPLVTLAQYLVLHPGTKLINNGVPAIRIQTGGGAGAWDNFRGDFDKFVIAVKTGSNTHTETYDFEPTSNPSIADTSCQTNCGGGIGGGSDSGSRARTTPPFIPQVLGAEDSVCDFSIDTYMRKGYRNNSEQVKILQGLLNKYVASGLVVDGKFGPKTEASVRAFQMKYKDFVLTPWGLKVPTGIFFRTTLIQSKNLECPVEILPIPTNLIPWSASQGVTPPAR